jgi:hypothetical protein
MTPHVARNLELRYPVRKVASRSCSATSGGLRKAFGPRRKALGSPGSEVVKRRNCAKKPS